MILCFTLSMLSRSSWDGRWSGDNRLYAKVINMGRSKKADQRASELVEKGSFSYNFGDGWSARVLVTEVSGQEARKIRHRTNGFCGYDWMIDSIRRKGLIIPN